MRSAGADRVSLPEDRQVDEATRRLEERPISLSKKLMAGVDRFVEMGMDQAYAGAPAEASEEEGHQSIDKLATMVASEVEEALARRRQAE